MDPSSWGLAVVLAQLVGVGAAVCGVLAYQLRGDRWLMICLAGAAGLWSLHFLLLGSLTAAALNAITAVRNVLALRRGLRGLGYVFIAGYLTAGLLTWQSAWEILPTVAVCLGAASVFFSQGLVRRSGLMVGGVLWFVFNIHVGSIPGMVIMFLETVSNGVYITRTLLRRRREGTG